MRLDASPSLASMKVISVTDNLDFALSGQDFEYRFHVHKKTGDLILDHFGSPTGPLGHADDESNVDLNAARRELPDTGRGDYRLPGIHIRQAKGDTVSEFKYHSHRLIPGKPALDGLPATFGEAEDVHTVVVTMRDEYSDLEAELSYSIFQKTNTIARSFKLHNKSIEAVTIERAASASVDLLPVGEGWDMVQLYGSWGREAQKKRRAIECGFQGFQSSAGYSSHAHNPFVALAPRSTTDKAGEAFGFSLVYSGSFEVSVEQTLPGMTRVLMGLSPTHLSWNLKPGETFRSPECCLIYEPAKGFGGMSRSLHKLYRNHLSRSKYTMQPRPVLANHWEAFEFDFDDKRLFAVAKAAAGFGTSLFVMDDGWFGVKHPRENDHTGLGDWVPNPKRFPRGMDAFIKDVNDLKPLNKKEPMKFGIWVEPEMVNPNSELYEQHPDWALHAGEHTRTEGRNQLVLNLALTEVQDYIIDFMSKLLGTFNIAYVKWDKNRMIHEMQSPSTAHQYMLGFYRVLHNLTTRFPGVLWEGCASGGGRFDPGMLQYFPQSWTSDDTDALERIFIQFGTTFVYPASSMGCHVSACPNGTTGRTTSLRFRAHVAMMGGSFGFELDPAKLTDDEKATLPRIVDLAERVNPLVVTGDMYRLALPEEGNWPAVQYLDPASGKSVIIAFQMYKIVNALPPRLLLQDLTPDEMYEVQVEDDESYKMSGQDLMHRGLQLGWGGDFDSKIVWVSPVDH